MKVNQFFEGIALLAPEFEPNDKEYLNKKLAYYDKQPLRRKAISGSIYLDTEWKGGPLLGVFDYPWVSTVEFFDRLDDAKLEKALKIVDKYVQDLYDRSISKKSVERARAKSECTEELFNAGLKDFI